MKDHELLDIIMESLEDDYYNGENELLPWTFSADELTPTEVLILIKAWNGEGKVWSFADAKNEDSIKGGYTYITEFQRGIYCIEITKNMGFHSIEKLYQMPPQF